MLIQNYSASATVGPISHESFKHGKAFFHVVYADFRNLQVSAETVHSQKLSSFYQMIKDHQPAVAITGTFFCPSSQRPVADVVVDGDLVAKGNRGSVVAVDWDGKVTIFDSKFNKPINWDNYRYALRGTVRVVTNGRVCPDPKSQKFKDKRLWGRAARTAIGTTKTGRVVLVATKNKVTLSELGRAMRKKGVTEAISLDGGGSTCLYYQGKMLIPPNRKLSTLFVIKSQPPERVVRTPSTQPQTITVAVPAEYSPINQPGQ